VALPLLELQILNLLLGLFPILSKDLCEQEFLKIWGKISQIACIATFERPHV
jgi:hypothetical protein